MSGIASKNELIVIALCCKHSGHLLIRKNPIVHVVPQGIRIQQISVSNLHPDAQWLGWRIRDEVFMEFPRTVRSLRVIWPLLIDKGSRISKDTVIQLRVIPRHDQGARASGTATHRRPAPRILG